MDARDQQSDKESRMQVVPTCFRQRRPLLSKSDQLWMYVATVLDYLETAVDTSDNPIDCAADLPEIVAAPSYRIAPNHDNQESQTTFELPAWESKPRVIKTEHPPPDSQLHKIEEPAEPMLLSPIAL